MKEFVIGVDAGGTKTEAAAYTLQGNLLCSHIAGMGNIAVDFMAASQNIKSSVKSCLSELNDCNCVGIIIGVAGGGIIELSRALKEFLVNEFTCPVSIINDALVNYYSVMGKQDGILVVAGTGSICLCKNEGEIFTVGGWGHLLGDEGSAYDIGIKALKTIIQDENDGVLSHFSKNILKSLSLTQPGQLKSYVYQGQKKDVAKIATLVDMFAKSSDQQAVRILQDAGYELAKTAITCIKKSKLNSPLSIGIKGSVIENSEIVRKSFILEIEKHFKNINFISSPNRLGSFGGYMYWKKNLI